MDKQIIVIAHNIRSAHNIGALLRLCDGIGVEEVYLSGYSPYPKQSSDRRLPHIANNAHEKIAKTALGSEKTVKATYRENIQLLLKQLKKVGYQIIGLEQAPSSTKLNEYKATSTKVAMLLGEEVHGIDAELLSECDAVVEITMLGKKESHNVITGASMALYHLRFIDI